MNFIIVSPRQTGGGPIVLHNLCRLLSKKGYNAKIFYWESYYTKHSMFGYWLRWIKYTLIDFRKLFCAHFFDREGKKRKYNGYSYKSVTGCKRKYTPFFNKKNTIVVYPEIMYGDPLKAKNKVRWLLYYLKDKDMISENELVICYRKIFNDWELNPNGYTVATSYFNTDLYRQTNFGERKGNCYMIRKGRSRDDLPVKYDGPILDDYSEKEIVEAFNRYEKCYIYDLQTGYGSIARLCGCIPIIVPEKGKCRDDYLKNGEKGYGRAYGETEEEINFAVNTINELREQINSTNIESEKSAEYFIELCKKIFNF